ncbi:hypothetical protein PR048_011327 [Dryococelus australis]|uniref:PiggyBac transposable element-derived protein domain-containing protein n=1 Tax=Dryococelus australis TaxID=614101 RepID=A0ABQ9HLA8_9NEOP|nr:hypothetical protein PR048_011327 [Dryococelus australis]
MFAVKNNPNKCLKVDNNEIEQFMGLCILVSVFGLPRSLMYWANNTRVETVASIMTCDHWEFYKSIIHLNDKTKKSSPNDQNRDRLFKVLLLVDEIQKMFKDLPLRQTLSHNPIKQHNFEIYTGSISSVEGLPDIGPISNILLRMLENLPRHQGYLL